MSMIEKKVKSLNRFFTILTLSIRNTYIEILYDEGLRTVISGPFMTGVMSFLLWKSFLFLFSGLFFSLFFFISAIHSDYRKISYQKKELKRANLYWTLRRLGIMKGK